MTNEIRSVSSTGGEKGVKLARHNLVPAEPLRLLAEHYGRGAEKYDAHQWRKGYEWSKSFDALMRHAWQFWAGENLDDETARPHMAAVAWHAFALLEFMQTHPKFDDRPNSEQAGDQVADLVPTDPDEAMRELQRYQAFGPGDVVDADRDHLLPSPPKVDPEEGDQLYVVTGPLIYMGGDPGVGLKIGDVVKVVAGIDAQGDVRVEIVTGSRPGVQQWIYAGSLTPKREQLDPQCGELYTVTGIPFYTEGRAGAQPCDAIHQGDVVRIIEGLDDDGDVLALVVGESNVTAYISTTVLTRLWI